MSNDFHTLPFPDTSGLAPRANPTFTGTAEFASIAVTGAALFGSGMTVGSIASLVGSAQVDSGTSLALAANCPIIRVRLTGNTTLTLPSSPALTANARTLLEVELVQDGTGGRTVSWTAAAGDTIEWDSSTTAPAIATPAGKETHFVFRRRAGSTTWHAAKIWQGA